MIKPLVSCIIPTHNRAISVVKAIKSVLAQSHNRTEIIVVDDSDNNDTKDNLEREGFGIKYIKNPSVKGAQYSRNVGIEESKGDFISFLDDDDEWLPEKIKTQLKYLKKTPIVGCNFIQVNKSKNYKYKLPDTVTYKKMLTYNYIGSCSFVIIDAKIQKNCFFDESFSSSQDWDMWLNLMNKYKIDTVATTKEYLVRYNNIENVDRISRIKLQDKINNKLKLYLKYSVDYNGELRNQFIFNNIVDMNSSFLDKELLKYLQLHLSEVNLLKRIAKLIKHKFGIVDLC